MGIALYRQLPAVAALMACFAAVALSSPAAAIAGEAPVKELLFSQIGKEADKTSGGDICTSESKHECQPGKRGSQAGAFSHPVLVAGAPSGDVYVADSGNNRIQELNAIGQFISMFGWDVNRTKVEAAAKGATVSQAERNVCVAGEVCQAGVEGGAPEHFGENLEGMAVDPVSGDVYVADAIRAGNGESKRIQKFTSTGQWILEIGKEVNETKANAVKAKGGVPTQKELEEENVCRQAEETKGVRCAGAAPSAAAQFQPGSFVLIGGLTAGGPEDLLYVGEQAGVQEFNSEGEAVLGPAEVVTAKLKLISSESSSHVSGIAVDNSCSLHNPVLTEGSTPTCKEFDSSYGDVYLTYQVGFTTNVIRKFSSDGQETVLPLSPRTAGNTVIVQRFAVDRAGRLAVTENEYNNTLSLMRGVLYAVGSAGLHTMTEFSIPTYESYVASSISFNGQGDLYVASQQPGNELTRYVPVSVGELVTGAIVPCEDSSEYETDVTVRCVLSGEVDPWGVPETGVWFEWGTGPALGEKTPRQIVNTSKGEGEEEQRTEVTVTVDGLRPHETLDYQLAGLDKNVHTPELLTGERVVSKTPSVPPRIVGEPEVLFVHSSSAVMLGHLNPENTSTEYAFQYAPSATCGSLAEACPGLAETTRLVAPDYGVIATTLEAGGLQPATTYRYRLIGINQEGQAAVDEQGEASTPEASFTTAPAPTPSAATGGSSDIGATSATIAGTVNPAGQPATYAFELGVDRGADTQYGIVFSGSAGSSSVSVERQLALSGLQPGTGYAYRIKVSSGYGIAYGATERFTTAGAPVIIQAQEAPVLLPVPPIAFPSVPRKVSAACKGGYKRDSHGKCAKVKTKKRHRHKAKRKK